MYPAVKASFPTIQTKWEGFTNWMYLDEKGLVTTGIGNLVDPLDSRALSLTWLHSDGSQASQQEITDAWNAVKDRQDLAQSGGGAFKSVSDLRLSKDSVMKLVGNVADSFDKTLAKRWPGYAHWPADAQLALLNIAWAYGPNFKFTGFDTALSGKLSPDFVKAGAIADAKFQQEVAKGNKGIEPRRVGTAQAFKNAHAVMKSHVYKTDKLHYPSTVSIAKAAAGGLLIAGGLSALVYHYVGKGHRAA